MPTLILQIRTEIKRNKRFREKKLNTLTFLVKPDFFWRTEIALCKYVKNETTYKHIFLKRINKVNHLSTILQNDE